MCDPTCFRVQRGRYGRVAVQPLSQRQAPHAHVQAQVMFALDDAETGAWIDGRRLRLAPRQAIAVDPCTRHHLQAPPGGSVRVLSLHLAESHLAACGAPTQRPFERGELPVDAELASAAHDLAQWLTADSPDAPGLQARVERVTRGVLRAAGTPASPPPATAAAALDRRLQRSLGSMHAAPGARDPIEALARNHGLSRPHFFKLFQQTFRLTPNVYRNMLRMEQALQAIETTDRPVGDVANDLGFSAQANFSRFFRSVEGVSPVAYRRALAECRCG